MASPSRIRLMSSSVGVQGVDGSMDPDAVAQEVNLHPLGPVIPIFLNVCLGGKTRTFDVIDGAVAVNNPARAAIAHISKEMAMGSGHALDGKKLLETGTTEPVQGGGTNEEALIRFSKCLLVEKKAWSG